MKMISAFLLSDWICLKLKHYSELERDDPTNGKYAKGRIYTQLNKELTHGECFIRFPKPMMSVQMCKRLIGALLIVIRQKGLKLEQVIPVVDGVVILSKKQ